MVFIGMPYTSWKGRSETEEEKKERFKIQQEKREQEEQIREKNIENDLKFAKEHYGTTGAYSYTIPVNDLPTAFQTSGATVRVHLANVIRYERTYNHFRYFYRTSKVEFSISLASLLNIDNNIADEVSLLLLQEQHIFDSILDSYLELNELEVNNELVTIEHGFRDPFYRKARHLILEKIRQAETHTRFTKCWKNSRYWKKKGLSKESILRLYSFADYFYFNDWDKYIYLKLFR